MLDINNKKLIKNGYRITNKRQITALRIRVPGGSLDVKYFDIIKDIAQKYGNGKVHITTRQGFEIPGIPMAKISEINEIIHPILIGMESEIGVSIHNPKTGYPAAGTRNISACIGNNVCPFANYNTTELSKKIEKLIYPHDFHVKIALTGCPNDCIKAHMQDIGVIGMVLPMYDSNRCIGCQACVKNCQKVATGALTIVNYKVKRDHLRCIGCGECILKCPVLAWTRGEKYYRMVVMGRTGKKNPRIAQTFMEWVDETAILKVIENLYHYIDQFIDRSLPKEHVGYIVDRTGIQVFKDYVLKDVYIGSLSKIANYMSFSGYGHEKSNYF
ncbi:MAG: sulfite reductase subunit C [Desulfobacterales bacterium]|nr:sulfite reductase subunit C [Desulfobacterales bacterium]